jgi:5'-3' exonuclease
MTTLFNALNLEQEENVMFIDGSYFCFHRYHSTLTWWKNAHPLEPLADPFLNPTFVEKYRKTIVSTVKDLPKNVKLDKGKNPVIIIGKDCKREDIWRNKLYPQYKGTRDNTPENGFMGKPFFKMTYSDNLFEEGGAKMILSHPHLEADDCIAISVKQILEQYPNIKITIITSDKDYLQLVEPRVQIFNLGYKNIVENKSKIGDAQTELFCKIVMGDSSDNITSVLKKCGPKTALKCYQDKEYFNKRMLDENAYDKFNLNQSIIDFNYIPKELVDEFLNGSF